MRTTIEVTSRAIRLCQEERGRIVALESFPLPPGADPVAALATATLPSPLGRVRLVMQHGDMLLRTMIQPPAPVSRLAKIVRFELAGAGDGEPVVSSWHLVVGAGADDMRLLTMVTKSKFIAELRAALKLHGGRLDALVHPAIGLYHAYRSLELGETGPALLVDVGGASLHLALVNDGELTFLRTQSPGMDDLIKQVAELRSISPEDASVLITKLGRNAPNDLRELIKRHISAIAGVLTANVRFAKAQLRIDSFEPKCIWIAGAGGQVCGFAEALAERMSMPVLPLNPFAGVTCTLPTEKLDRLSVLPSPWTVVVGAGGSPALELDALDEEREQRALFWRTEGILRIAACVVAGLMLLALVIQQIALHTTQAVVDSLAGNGSGYVPKAQEAKKELDAINNEKVTATDHLVWLDGERRPGRIAVEMLAAIAEQEDPSACPVYLQKYTIKRNTSGTQVIVDIEGFAQGTGKSGSDAVLHRFEQGLVKRYLPITAIEQLPTPIDRTKQQFRFRITICDRQAEASRAEPVDKDGQASLQLNLQVPDRADYSNAEEWQTFASAAARVAAIRARTRGETSVAVTVTPLLALTEAKGSTPPQTHVVSFKD